MVRVLLVIDDYNEMVYLQTLLKKLGFDVDGIQNQKKFSETLLVMNPELVIATARGKRVDGIRILAEIETRPSPPELFLLKGPGQVLSPDQEGHPLVTAVLESPVNIRDLLERMAETFSLDKTSLIDKYLKIKSKASPDESDATVEGLTSTNRKSEPSTQTSIPLIVSPSTMSSEERQNRFKKMLEELESFPSQGFESKKVSDHNKALRATENIDELKDLEEERRAFVKALFEKNKN